MIKPFSQAIKPSNSTAYFLHKIHEYPYPQARDDNFTAKKRSVDSILMKQQKRTTPSNWGDEMQRSRGAMKQFVRQRHPSTRYIQAHPQGKANDITQGVSHEIDPANIVSFCIR